MNKVYLAIFIFQYKYICMGEGEKKIQGEKYRLTENRSLFVSISKLKNNKIREKGVRCRDVVPFERSLPRSLRRRLHPNFGLAMRHSLQTHSNSAIFVCLFEL